MSPEAVDACAKHRVSFPDDDYALRSYQCSSCETVSIAVAPRAELGDHYCCRTCGRPQRPLGPALPRPDVD